MSTAAVMLQRAIRRRLIAWPGVTAWVPPHHILDTNARPSPDPAIILGEAQTVEGDALDRSRVRVYHVAHVWRREAGLYGVGLIAGQIRAAIHAAPLRLGGPFHCVGAHVSSIRTLRDPGGELGHAVVTIEAVVEEATPSNPPVFQYWHSALNDYDPPGYILTLDGGADRAILFTYSQPTLAGFTLRGTLDELLSGELQGLSDAPPADDSDSFTYRGADDAVLVLYAAAPREVAGFTLVAEEAAP